MLTHPAGPTRCLILDWAVSSGAPPVNSAGQHVLRHLGLVHHRLLAFKGQTGSGLAIVGQDCGKELVSVPVSEFVEGQGVGLVCPAVVLLQNQQQSL